MPCTVLGTDRVAEGQRIPDLTEISGKETKAQRGEITNPRSAQQVAEI